MEELDEFSRQLRLDIQAAIDEADRGLCEPFDLDEIKAELQAEFDELGIPQ